MEQIHHQGTRHVIGAGAVARIGSFANRMLPDPAPGPQAGKMMPFDPREDPRRQSLGGDATVRPGGLWPDHLDRSQRMARFAGHLGEDCPVAVADGVPTHVGGQRACAVSDFLPLNGMGEEREQPVGERLDVVEWKQDPAAAGEELPRVLVGCRDARSTGGHGICQRPRGSLLGIPVRGDEEVRGLQPGHQLVVIDVAIHEQEVTLEAERLRSRSEGSAIAFPVSEPHLWVRGTDDRESSLWDTIADSGEGIDHQFEALGWTKQAERKDERPFWQAEAGPCLGWVDYLDLRYAVRNDLQCIGRGLVFGAEQVPRTFAHYHDTRRSPHQLDEDGALERCGMGADRVQGGDEGHPQGRREPEDVT
ncbi:MAG TPA: hypothetical protein VES36_03470, partial [Candidatus Limnocylindrales bacterium]|nr:hypothetical protein [Candidatus Limnocylindrales bacterium]